MSFAEYMVVLQRRWRILVAAILVGLLLAVAYNQLAEKRYTATATSFVTVTDAEAAGSGEIFQGSQFTVQRMASYASLSRSPGVLGGVVEELGVDISPRTLRSMVEVSSPPESVLLEVAVEDVDPGRAAAIADEVSEQLAVAIEELETPRGRAASTVEVTLTQPAEEPTEPSAPRETLNLLLGLVAGGGIGLVLALLRHHLDRRVKTAEDVRAITHVAPLGTTIATRGARNDPLVALRYRSVAAEHYRTIRTALKLADVDHDLRHLVVSSPFPDDGRAVVAGNLAVSWALAGARVCLVDAALRRPEVADLFDVDGSVGLTDVLVGDVTLDAALTPWNDGMLSVLPAGSLPPDPVALLGSEAMAALVAELRSRFDVVVYDSDPVVAVTDAVVLAHALDGLVLVVRSASTRRDQLARCVERIREARVPFLGTVLSDVKVRRRARKAYLAVRDDVRRAELPDRRESAGARHQLAPRVESR